ncbi:nuclear transport factor 2 family protein [Mycobacterium neumannii]|uniref:nuclear transport factor 2 family protein n=1 Tax=Mycobacterium neumannii TaxID=2048551 RepID=UPI003AB911A6
MSESIERLMEGNLLRVFNERDADRRRAAIADTYSPDVRWTDDEGVSVGHDALDAKAQALQDGQLAGLSFVKAGPVHHTRGFGYVPWNVVAPGSTTPIVSGFDVALSAEDRITDLFTVITGAPQ